MTPKEKAVEMYEEFKRHQKPSLGISSNSFNINDTNYNAKLCALACVEFIFELADEADYNKNYYRAVKQELKSLK